MPADANDPPGVSRRTFLTGASLAAAGAARLSMPAGTEVHRYGPGLHEIRLKFSDSQKTLKVETRTTLLDALRDHLDMTGTKKVCDRGSCGACTVLLDNEPVNSCMVLAMDATDKTIDPIESFSTGDKLHPLQQAFVDCDALQCGYCTPGMIVSAHACLQRHPEPTLAQMQAELSGNLCRCGTYGRVFEAVQRVAKARKGK